MRFTRLLICLPTRSLFEMRFRGSLAIIDGRHYSAASLFAAWCGFAPSNLSVTRVTIEEEGL